MKTRIKSSARSFLRRYHALRLQRYYKRLLRMNGISDSRVQGESEWCEKWAALGMKANSVYYRLFSRYIGNDARIVPEDICHDVIENVLNPMRYAKFYADKNVFDLLMPDGYLAKTLLRKMNGAYYDDGYRRLCVDEKALQAVLAGSGTDKIIIKPSVGGSSGMSVRCFVKEHGIWNEYGGGDELTLQYLEDNYGRDFIVQEFLCQHEAINHFCKTSVNTLRLTLYRSVKNDECVVPSAIMRIGNDGSVVDNAHAGGGYVGIDVDSGELKHEVLDQYGRRRQRFNGVDFAEQQRIPYELWVKVVQFAKSVGERVPHHRLLALDLMIDVTGCPRLVEFNVESYSMWLFQFTVGPAFGKYTDEIIDYCKSRLDTLEYQMFF